MMTYNRSMGRNTAREAMIFFFMDKRKTLMTKNIAWKMQDICGEEGEV